MQFTCHNKFLDNILYLLVNLMVVKPANLDEIHKPV